MSLFKKNSVEEKKLCNSEIVATFENRDSQVIEKYGKTKNSLDSTAVINGKVCFETSIRIEGKLNGEMTAKKIVVVGPSGVVNAQIKAETLVVMGVVKGDIEVTKAIEILAGGSVEGSIITPSINIETGAKFNGNCTMKFNEVLIEEAKETNIIIVDEKEANNSEDNKTLLNGGYNEDEPLHH